MSQFHGAKSHGKISRPGPHSKKDEQEFGKAKKEFIECMNCGSCYFEKSWHHSLDQAKLEHLKQEKMIKFDLCPACKMGKEKRYEGEVVIKISGTMNKQEIMNEIKNSDLMARQKDPMDRVLWTEDKPDGLHVFTSENQLAVKIGKKIKSSLGKGTLTIDHSQDEDVTRVYFE